MHSVALSLAAAPGNVLAAVAESSSQSVPGVVPAPDGSVSPQSSPSLSSMHSVALSLGAAPGKANSLVSSQSLLLLTEPSGGSSPGGTVTHDFGSPKPSMSTSSHHSGFASQVPSSPQLSETQSSSSSHISPSSQVDPQTPPQSTSVSSWFISPSSQPSPGWQVPAASSQLFEMQSPSPLQVSSVSHVGPHEPPQSTSVSSPPCSPSSHDGSTQRSATSWQVLETQSPSSSQPSPSSHVAPHTLPQSTSVSSWFWTSSSHVPSQTPASEHASEMQSESSLHNSPSSQVAPQLPPQSTSVSLPFCAPSSHPPSPPESHVPSASLQLPDWQSSSPPQPFPSPHWLEQEPPQSISVSSPFCTPSLQSPPAESDSELVSVELSVSLSLPEIEAIAWQASRSFSSWRSPSSKQGSAQPVSAKAPTKHNLIFELFMMVRSYFCSSLNSMRRFLARPDLVALLSRGSVSPAPRVSIRSAPTPWSTRYCFTDSARWPERSML